MNASVSTIAAPLPGASLYHRLVLRALRRLSRGHLTLVLPDGGRLHFGAGQAGSEPRGTVPGFPPPAVIHVRHPAFFRRCVLQGDIGFAESFIAGDWDTPDLTAVVAWFIQNLEDTPTLSGSAVRAAGVNLLRGWNRLAHWLRPNSRRSAARNIRDHYDLSNEFFALWLDPSMMYSSGRWLDPAWSLAEAQRAKNHALATKLQLGPDDHVLEIGTGWGGWSLQAARDFGCRVTTLTLSPRQRDLAVERVRAAGLADRVTVRLQDYRALPAGEKYDKIVSIEMLEAVGHDYLGEWCAVVSRALRPEGAMALQFITCPDSRYDELRRGVDFIQKHVFPGSLLISPNRLNNLLADAGGFVLRSFEDFGPDYARTLRHWREQFVEQQDRVAALGFDGAFQRKWNYYFSYCEAAFAMRNISVVQTVHARPNHRAF